MWQIFVFVCLRAFCSNSDVDDLPITIDNCSDCFVFLLGVTKTITVDQCAHVTIIAFSADSVYVRDSSWVTIRARTLEGTTNQNAETGVRDMVTILYAIRVQNLKIRLQGCDVGECVWSISVSRLSAAFALSALSDAAGNRVVAKGLDGAAPHRLWRHWVHAPSTPNFQVYKLLGSGNPSICIPDFGHIFSLSGHWKNRNNCLF